VIVKQCYGTSLVKRKLLLDDPWYQLILAMMNSVIQSVHRKRVLEVGCGFGGFCIRIAEKGANVVGLDISSSAVRKARDFAKRARIRSQVDFIVGDAQLLPFRDRSAEIVVCSETLEHVDNYEQAFDELVRVTKKEGCLCVTVPNLLSTFFFECIVSLSIGQPKYVKKFFSVEKEHVFHLFKVKKLFSRKDLKVLKLQGADLFHLSLVMRKALKRDDYLRVPTLLGKHGPEKLFGATLGIVARKE
jgi:ubiquinone/menaquinone biosynthesis C-methylase UbiE